MFYGATDTYSVAQRQTANPVPSKEEAPFYQKPISCNGKFAFAMRKQYGSPVINNCVGLGYEQANYLKWINSSFAAEE